MHAKCHFCLLHASACIMRGEMLPIILSLYVGQLYVSPAAVKLLALSDVTINCAIIKRMAG